VKDVESDDLDLPATLFETLKAPENNYEFLSPTMAHQECVRFIQNYFSLSWAETIIGSTYVPTVSIHDNLLILPMQFFTATLLIRLPLLVCQYIQECASSQASLHSVQTHHLQRRARESMQDKEEAIRVRRELNRHLKENMGISHSQRLCLVGMHVGKFFSCLN